ncbi:SelB C-terminal domain-containing protein [Actinokineospora enzanensis]|uniref:SelB domain-containing protein n=1 Tax=Actinokineospora enzanensis TaxID=155975 RepID=UPI00316ABBFC
MHTGEGAAMRVVATAGHVDHGKSTLVWRLTGMDPDRLAVEKARGVTIELGFAWTDLPGAGQVAFVDVPGHERFVPTMLAGVGPVPAVIFVVAADAPWMAQAEEHLLALDALGVRHGLLVVTRADLADPAPITKAAQDRIAETTLGRIPTVIADDIDQVRQAIARMVNALPRPDTESDVRLWIDRSFTVQGAGTVVTGTLQAGTLRVGDDLDLDGTPVRVRGLHTLGHPRTEVTATARVAVNLRNLPRDRVNRGDALTTPGAAHQATVVDIDTRPRHRQAVLHIGAAAVPVRVHPLGTNARLVLARPLPLRVGDRVLLRDPGDHHIQGATITDLDRLDRAPFHTTAQRKALGRNENHIVNGWHTDPDTWRGLVARTAELLAQNETRNPLGTAPPTETIRRALRLPDPALVPPLISATKTGKIRELPTSVTTSVDALAKDLDMNPFHAPTAERLRELGLGKRELAAAVRVGRLRKVAEGIVLLPDAPARAIPLLHGIPQPFTTSQARQALDTSRQVALAVLDILDRDGVTERLPDNTRRLRNPDGG